MQLLVWAAGLPFRDRAHHSRRWPPIGSGDAHALLGLGGAETQFGGGEQPIRRLQ